MRAPSSESYVAIACGGTGGHVFPGLAVAEVLAQRGVPVSLFVSPKEVDQQAVRTVTGMAILTLPAVALQRGHLVAFARGFWESFWQARKHFLQHRPGAVLAMGGFTSAPPILAARLLGIPTFLHEANSIPGRANRWLAPFVNQIFVGFPKAVRRFRRADARMTGTPVRSQFRPRDAAACRLALGLNPHRPVLLIMGGSQGAHAVNELALRSLPILARLLPELQFLHLTGVNQLELTRKAYATNNLEAVVFPFLDEMETALGAATVAISRAGASSLAEMAAMRLSAILIPYPSAADNHQYHNALAYVETGAARMLYQPTATPATLAQLVWEMVETSAARESIRAVLGRWVFPHAASQIADVMLTAMGRRQPVVPTLAPVPAAPRIPETLPSPLVAPRDEELKLKAIPP